MYPLPEGFFAPRNQWYVAAWAGEVTRAPMERWILDEPVAFYRTEAGRAVALAGRCPHRHFPLGKSRVVGDDIECGYHGITFDPSGACVRIPTQAQIPAACRVKSYPLAERWRWLWIWPGDPALADERLIPDHAELGLLDPEYTAVSDVYYPVPGRYSLMHDNLLDLSHLGFLHQSTIASGGIGEAAEIRDEGPGWLSSTRRMPNVECPLLFQNALNYTGRVDRAFGMKWYLPCLHVGFDEFRRPAQSPAHAGAHLGTIRVFHVVTPGRRHDAHYFFAFTRSFKTGDEEFGRNMLDGLRVTLEEDMTATREIETILQTLGGNPGEVLVRGDANCVRGRRLLEEMIRCERAPGSATLAAAS